MKNRMCFVFSLFLVLAVAILGCQGVKVPLPFSQGVKVPLDNYKASFSGGYEAYKGKRVYIMNFDNQANDTTIWRYFSPDKKFGYIMNDTLHNYFWYAFRNAFLKNGMLVSTVDNPDPAAPAMWVTLLSITDEQYRVQVTVQKKSITEFTNPYTIQEPPADEKDRTPELLEQRAYRMTNRLIETILKDTNFQKVIMTP
jgi:hypothetical protein